MNPRPPASNGWVLYDGECAFCVKWLNFLSPILARRGFAAAPLQDDWVEGALHMPLAESIQDIRLLTSSDELYSGAEAYLYGASRIWWAWPFAKLFRLPGFHAVLEAGYKWFARNRYCVAGQCKLPSHRS